jgi:hypothetical protein
MKLFLLSQNNIMLGGMPPFIQKYNMLFLYLKFLVILENYKNK